MKSKRAAPPSPAMRGTIQTWLAQPSTLLAGVISAASIGGIARPRSMT